MNPTTDADALLLDVLSDVVEYREKQRGSEVTLATRAREVLGDVTDSTLSELTLLAEEVQEGMLLQALPRMPETAAMMAAFAVLLLGVEIGLEIGGDRAIDHVRAKSEDFWAQLGV